MQDTSFLVLDVQQEGYADKRMMVKRGIVAEDLFPKMEPPRTLGWWRRRWLSVESSLNVLTSIQHGANSRSLLSIKWRTIKKKRHNDLCENLHWEEKNPLKKKRIIPLWGELMYYKLAQSSLLSQRLANYDVEDDGLPFCLCFSFSAFSLSYSDNGYLWLPWNDSA